MQYQSKEQELFQMLSSQAQLHKTQKMTEIYALKKQRILELKKQKKNLSDGLAHHQFHFKHSHAVGGLFSKEKPLQPKPANGTLNRIQSAWLPTNTNSRILSPCTLDTEPTQKQTDQKEKLWRPFSSQPIKMNQIQILSASAKETALAAQKHILINDDGQKWQNMKPFHPVRRICSAFPLMK